MSVTPNCISWSYVGGPRVSFDIYDGIRGCLQRVCRGRQKLVRGRQWRVLSDENGGESTGRTISVISRKRWE